MPASIRDCLRQGRASLGASDCADLEAEVLLAHALRKPRSHLYAWPERELDADTEAEYLSLLEQRRQGRPLAQIIGEREFWSLPLAVTEAVLTPRPDTERLVETALELGPPGAAEVLDLGTGSGAIAIALASERPGWRITATDASPAALAVAAANLRRHGLEQRVQLREGDWYAACPGLVFDLIVSNPPYIRAQDPHLRQPELRHEPTSALVGGADGLAAIRQILAGLADHLRPGGWLLLEHGFDQGRAVQGLLAQAGLMGVFTRSDAAGHDRVSGGRLPNISENGR